MTTIKTIGRITKDFELKKSERSGCVYANFTLAANDGFGDNQTTMFFECTAFGADAERMIKAKVQKGSLIEVVGKFSTSEYERRDGGTGHSLKITVLAWGYIPGAGSKKEPSNADESSVGATTGAPAQSPASDGYVDTPDLDDDDLPF